MNMQSAYVYLVDGSIASTVTLEDVKTFLQKYRNKTSKTGQQLDWNYTDASFPYHIEEPAEGKDTFFILKGKDQNLYKYVIIGVGTRLKDNQERAFIQVSIPDTATQNDKSKGNEYSRYLAREVKGELHLFNGRIQYFQPRKP
ncbi:DUF1885 family protein [Brevibacillus laterosporus]|uniref:DUF1885 family protein n=1 Tax=Brevibacillus laterosporus TaxID=1465 RepID=UPI00264E1D3F|nr:DUF1885 family protein [Brevibacillus laterosporus]MDN9012208.1 DUF1885 family protein [Brevibacillus laterosporus]MDO0943304.1 DUF1885 family protein [Brevibacillus laterosporus]